MYRIRLASGEESAFRSIEELARGIQSGVISAEAEVFHYRTQQWLPITAHPEYEVACGRAIVLAATSDSEPIPLPALLEAAGGPSVPIYQMFSRSAKELAERRRPSWVMPAAIGFVGFVLAIGLVLLLVPERVGPEDAGRITNIEQRSTSSPSHLAPISADSFRAARVAPANLAGRLARGVDSTRRLFRDASQGAGLTALLNTDRLRTVQGLRSGLTALAAYDSLLRGYRVAQHRLDSIYRDSAVTLAELGIWSRSDLQAWRVRAPRLDASVGGARVDSVVSTIGRVYILLLAQQDSVTITPTAIHFMDRAGGAAYDSLRTALTRLTQAHSPPAGQNLPEPIAVLLQGLADGSLPPRAAR